MRTWKVCVLLLIIMGGFAELKAQQDTLIMNSGEVLLGELKWYDNGIVIIETSYSDSDFKIEGDKVAQLSTFHQYVILTAHGDRYYGSLAYYNNNPSIVVINDAEKGSRK